MVLAVNELVSIAKVDSVEGIVAKPPDPDPGGAPLMDDTHRAKELM
jgi:hypothetical protein